VRSAGEEWYAVRLLRLLLESRPPEEGPTLGGEEILLPLAQRNGLLVRTAERLKEAGIVISPHFRRVVEAERLRVRTALGWIDRISTLCAGSGLEFLFPKAFQHYPDMGRDLDLLLLSRSSAAAARVLEALPTSRCRRGLAHWIAGTTTYRIEGCVLPLDVHHGRLGLAGEHGGYPAMLIRNSRRLSLDGRSFMAPSLEDQWVLRGMQGVYSRRSLRLADIVATIASLREDTLDWEYVVETSKRLGTLPGLSGYLHTVDAIHARIFGSEILSGERRHDLKRENWGPPRYRAGHYWFPGSAVVARLYGRKLLSAAVSGDWVGAVRICLIPLVVRPGQGSRNGVEPEQEREREPEGSATATGAWSGPPLPAPIDR
jgi:Uncharacterised nucleotidyltransferase